MNPVVCVDLYNELNSLKRNIDKHPEWWEYRKRAINPYECVFSSFNHAEHSFRNIRTLRSEPLWDEWRTVFSKKSKGKTHTDTRNPIQTSLSAVHPISRAFFKMTELSHLVRIYPKSSRLFSKPVRVLHLAESPGGFIQSWRWHRERAGLIDDATGVTIEKQHGKDPWDRLREVSRDWKHPPRMIVGDLCNLSMRQSITAGFTDENGVALVTGDGGFDFSIDYCSQEEQATPLILAEMIVGLRSLRKDGAFILKVFDVVTLPMLQILWVFWKSFQSFQLIKPKTSRACNSERYIVARGFRGLDMNLLRFLTICDGLLQSEVRPIRTLFETGPNASWETMDPAFRKGVGIIEKIMKTQLSTINAALHIDPEEPEETRKQRENTSVALSRAWCEYYGIPVASSHIISYPQS